MELAEENCLKGYLKLYEGIFAQGKFAEGILELV